MSESTLTVQPVPNSLRSLREGIDPKTKWYPVSISKWRKLISALEYQGNILIPNEKEVSNIAYSFQYLEYLEQTLTELSLSAVLEKQTIKSYIIFAIGVIECILMNACKRAGKPFGKLYHAIAYIQEHKIFGSKVNLYKELDRFRDLRNRVHLSIKNEGAPTDYHLFGRSELKIIRKTLFDLMTTPQIMPESANTSSLDFLKQVLWTTKTG